MRDKGVRVNYIIYPNVEIGKNCEIGDYVVIGVKTRTQKDKDVKTIISDNSIIRSHTVIYAGNIIGENFQTGHFVLIRENNKIGKNVSIGSGSDIEYEVIIEDDVRIHSKVFIPEYSILKKGCWVGPNVVFTNAKYPRSKHVKENLVGPIIEESAKIGANVTLLPAIRIGKYSLIGAGSVVTKDVPAYTVVCGNPAKVVKRIDEIEEYK
ncbi:MAG: DapH/DapD/GlmU-related protein [Candidatus Hydrogenedentota bacterium]